MHTPSKSSRNRLKVVLFGIMFIVMVLIGRLGYLQIYKSEELKKGALEQWTKSIPIRPKRGIIYDRKGKKLAVSISTSTVWATPADVKDPKATAAVLAQVLNMDETLVYEKITKNTSVERIKLWISKDEANELRKLRLRGITVADDNKRYYPNGNFASYILGFTDTDNNGLEGIELIFNKYLTGTAGRWVRITDAGNRQLPYDGEKIYDATDGLSLVLTIDETIQHFADKAAEQALFDNKAKNVSIIVMEPNTGDILALSNKKDYDPNNPREPLDEETKKEWESLPLDELKNRWYDSWRNIAISDIYEPGSTFKIITAAAALEENIANVNSHYYCNGFVKDIKGVVLKCSRWYNPHGDQTFVEAMNNSCNVAFVQLGRQVGKETLLKYIKAFGFGENTGIDLPGEQGGIIPSNIDAIKEVHLATMSYGHGIAVTPLQLANALSAIANGGNLMKPRLVKELIDNEGNVVENFEPEIIRKVLSESTSKTMLSMLEQVVSEGTGTKAYVPGYRVAGKTGTAQKIVDGRYVPGKYIASFAAVAPADNPKIAILVVIDDPGAGQYYGGTIASPVAKTVIEETLNYLEVPPVYSEKEKEKIDQKVIVPDIRHMKIGDAGRTLSDLGLRYTTEYLELTSESIILDQFPLPGVEVLKGSIIDLYLNVRTEEIIMPDLSGKTKDEVIDILDELNIQYTFQGNGKVIKQSLEPGNVVDLDMNIEVVFSDNKM